MSDPLARITGNLPAAFFQRLLEYADAGFSEALAFSKQHVEAPERANMLGQLRHARCEAGFRKAAEESGVTVRAPHTEPAGGRYSLVATEGVYLIRGNIQTHCGPPRATSFRRTWAALNRWLDPLQLDLLRRVEHPPADRLCGMIVITAHPRHGDPSVPAFVGLGVPRADLSAWVVLEPLSSLLGLYHDADSRIHMPIEAPIEVKDRAVPKLKKRPDSGT